MIPEKVTKALRGKASNESRFKCHVDFQQKIEIKVQTTSCKLPDRKTFEQGFAWVGPVDRAVILLIPYGWVTL